jgi:serine/threonine protein kinase
MAPAVSPGSKLGPYRIVSHLGAGGMGEVFRAHDERLNRDVAIKILPADVASDHDRLARFELEARASAALNHPNIVGTFDLGQAEGHTYVVMEVLEGATLRDEIAARPPSPRKATEWAVDIAKASPLRTRRVSSIATSSRPTS